MKLSLKNKMFLGFTATIIVTQMILILASTLFMEPFLIYGEIKELELVLGEITINEETDFQALLTDIHETTGGGAFITTEGLYSRSRDLTPEMITSLTENLDLQTEQFYKHTEGQNLFILTRLDEEHVLFTMRSLLAYDQMKEVLNIYLGVSTVIVFAILLFSIYHYINHYEGKITLEAQREILYSLGRTADAHFAENGEHIERVSMMMYRFARVLGLSKKESERIKLASTMHDIGKIAIPDKIIKKPGRLTIDEYEIMKTHTNQGMKILGNSKLPVLQLATTIAAYHHERVDGKGYPYHLVGDEIPLEARMMAIVDVYDALTNDRVYKAALSQEETLVIMGIEKGYQFDLRLFNIFVRYKGYIVHNIKEDENYVLNYPTYGNRKYQISS